jgi:hypothetical protein
MSFLWLWKRSMNAFYPLSFTKHLSLSRCLYRLCYCYSSVIISQLPIPTRKLPNLQASYPSQFILRNPLRSQIRESFYGLPSLFSGRKSPSCLLIINGNEETKKNIAGCIFFFYVNILASFSNATPCILYI